MLTSASTQVFAVIGHPVGHSLSPAMHSAAIDALGLDAVYVAFDIEPGRIPAAMDGMRAMGIRGMNVTIPHKAAVMECMDVVEETARLARGVNTVTNDQGHLVGSSTDGPGFMRSLSEAGVDVAAQSVVIAGSGGGARAIAAALAAEAQQVTIAARNADARTELASMVHELGGRAAATDLTRTSLSEALARSSILINTTPLGMWPNVADCIPVRENDLTPNHVVVDIVPNPTNTLLLRRADSQGAKTVDGLGMLVHQGAISLETWTGQPAPVDGMRAAAEAMLAARRGG
ncbi:MAG: shikimate dehydrogenase [Armatimonadia bacterium]|nr:shikimate dehydrogenase [Armatimonadia bacterium]